MIKIRFNDSELSVAEQSSLQQVLASQDDYKNNCAVAVNRRFIPRVNYANTHLQEGDIIELITPMQGG